MKIHIDQHNVNVIHIKTSIRYLQSEKLLPVEEAENMLADCNVVLDDLQKLKDHFGDVYTSPNHKEVS